MGNLFVVLELMKTPLFLGFMYVGGSPLTGLSLVVPPNTEWRARLDFVCRRLFKNAKFEIEVDMPHDEVHPWPLIGF